MRFTALAVLLLVSESSFGQNTPNQTGADLSWKKLEARVDEITARLDGIMGIAILDLTDGKTLSRNGDRIFPTASSIKLTILLELYRQDQEARGGAQGKARLTDTYTFDPKDLIEVSDHGGPDTGCYPSHQSRYSSTYGGGERQCRDEHPL